MKQSKRNNFSEDINSKLLDYYKNYYKTTLGLPNWNELCQLRLNEEDIYCSAYIEKIKEWQQLDFVDKNVLVVGSGTGGELVNFHQEGANVYGIEPYDPAREISQLKVAALGFSEDNIKSCKAENIDFEDNFFDFVYCYTVIEHVEDVDKSIKEMIRVTKSNGLIFLHAPDYRQMYEGHYKLPLPMFLPIWMNKLILITLGRPAKFLDSINKVNAKKIKKLLTQLPVVAMEISLQREKRSSNKTAVKFIFFIQDSIYRIFGISMNQMWLVKKINNQN